MPALKLTAHPRLYINTAQHENLAKKKSLAFLKDAEAHVKRTAEAFLKTPLTYPQKHNALLERARLSQIRVVTWLVRWQQTGNSKYRNAVIKHVQDMRDWEYWSWLSWRDKNKAVDSTFDLSYGENCATLAIAYDWLYTDLNQKEKDLFISTANKWAFSSGLKYCKKGCSWWFGKNNSNWNTVCAGGLGMLALAMYEDVAAARKLLPRVEESIAPFINHLKETKGAWPEGIGYWNYGMRYAFMYILSHEQATGKKHPLLKHSSVKKTLHFPLDFCPNGVPCSFGDVNAWSPIPFHYAIAQRLGEESAVAKIDAHPKKIGPEANWPHAAEWLLFHNDQSSSKPKHQTPYVNFYKGMDWVVMADRMPQPKMYMSIRGGDTKVPHGQRDLMSFFCVVGNEALLSNCKGGEYLDTTFSGRREELFEIGPQSKNSLLINGVGISVNSALDSTNVSNNKGQHAVRLIATTAMGPTRGGVNAAKFCGRSIIMLKSGAYVIIDAFDLNQLGRVESRFHSYAEVTCTKNSAAIRGKKNRLRMQFASSVDSLLVESQSTPTTPSIRPAHVMRWCSNGLEKSVCFATLITAGAGKHNLKLQQDAKGITITATINGKREIVRCSKTLRLR